MKGFQVYGIQSSDVIEFEENVGEIFIQSLKNENFELKDHDIVVITSKILSMQEKSAVLVETVTPTDKANKLAKKANMDPKVVQLILDEANHDVYGAVEHAILAKTPYGLSANAGIDQSNAPEGYALLLPPNPDELASDLRKFIKEETGKQVAVIISDSRTIPLRRGTSGVAIGIAGMEPLIDERGTEDLYGYKMVITSRAMADNAATSANIVMGETNERIPFAIVRGMEYKTSEDSSISTTLMPEHQCLYFAPLLERIEGIEENE